MFPGDSAPVQPSANKKLHSQVSRAEQKRYLPYAAWNDSALRSNLFWGKNSCFLCSTVVCCLVFFLMIFNLVPCFMKCKNATVWGRGSGMSFCETVLEGHTAPEPRQTCLWWRRRHAEAVVQQSFIVRMDCTRFFQCKMEHDPKSSQNRSAFRNAASWSSNTCLPFHTGGHKPVMSQSTSSSPDVQSLNCPMQFPYSVMWNVVVLREVGKC